jgi:hypothetical protein
MEAAIFLILWLFFLTSASLSPYQFYFTDYMAEDIYQYVLALSVYARVLSSS